MADQCEFGDSSLDEDGTTELPPVLCPEPPSSPTPGLLEALTTYTTAVQVREEPRTDLSYAEQALGQSRAPRSTSHVKESPLIQRALQSARSRFLAPSVVEGSMSGAEASSDRAPLSQPVGSLAPPPNLLPPRGVHWQSTSFRPRCKPLFISDEEKDRLGLSDRTPSRMSITDKTLRSFEYCAAQGLASVGAQDTLIAALATALAERDVSASQDGPHEDPALRDLLTALVERTHHCAEFLATLYFNSVLLRRDLLLSSSILPSAARATARSVPVSQPFLLGTAARQVVTDAAAHASHALALRASVASAAKARRPAPPRAPPRKAPRMSAPARTLTGSAAPARKGSFTSQRRQPRRQDQRRASTQGKRHF